MSKMTFDDFPESLVSRYFRDVSDNDMLTVEREQRLARRLSRCFVMVGELAGQSEPSTLREARACYDSLPTSLRANRVRRLIEASRDLLIRSNLRLAVHIARRHEHAGGSGMSDLIQEANVGLIKAVDRFDPARGFRFSTYAYWWITEEVRRSQKRGQRVVHTPDHIVDEIRQLQTITMRLHHRLARAPRQSELAREMEVSPSRISEIRGFAAAELSTELPVGIEGGTSLGDTLSDSQPNPMDLVRSRDHGRVLESLLAQLNDREQEVLKRRFGINLRTEETLQVISDDLGISRERVRQIEKSALRKLQQIRQEQGRTDTGTP
ncbi:RNA polymerase sigma factor RpoD/SigA [Marinobacter lacisalsi]|uniref:RNA polymerase sigma factor RpoD/SigA n=1 Tax=Marinobacter lacisalsi TaxID=475979 RepID=A0ABV8QCT6_9GAMM